MANRQKLYRTVRGIRVSTDRSLGRYSGTHCGDEGTWCSDLHTPCRHLSAAGSQRSSHTLVSTHTYKQNTMIRNPRAAHPHLSGCIISDAEHSTHRQIPHRIIQIEHFIWHQCIHVIECSRKGQTHGFVHQRLFSRCLFFI